MSETLKALSLWPRRDPPADGVPLAGAAADEPGAAAEDIRRAGHRLDSDRATALPRRESVARLELHIVGGTGADPWSPMPVRPNHHG